MNLLGVQTFGIEKELTSDLPGTVTALHHMGFNAIEPLVLLNEKQGRMPKNLWAMDTLEYAKSVMDRLGMTIPSVHVGVGFGPVAMPAGTVIKKLLGLHNRFGIKYFVISGPFDSARSAKKWGKLACKVAAGLKPAGCTLVYHNHDDEFHKISVTRESMTALDYFFSFAGPDVGLQLDIGWASVGGDEIAAAKQYADRIVSLHLKDFYHGYRDGAFTRKNMPVEQFAPIGEGTVHTADVVALRNRFPQFQGSVIIDQDKFTGNMMEALQTGVANVAAMLAEGGEI